MHCFEETLQALNAVLHMAKPYKIEIGGSRLFAVKNRGAEKITATFMLWVSAAREIESNFIFLLLGESAAHRNKRSLMSVFFRTLQWQK